MPFYIRVFEHALKQLLMTDFSCFFHAFIKLLLLMQIKISSPRESPTVTKDTAPVNQKTQSFDLEAHKKQKDFGLLLLPRRLDFYVAFYTAIKE